MTFCMNVSRFMNLAAIFSLDLESQSMDNCPCMDIHKIVHAWISPCTLAQYAC